MYYIDKYIYMYMTVHVYICAELFMLNFYVREKECQKKCCDSKQNDDVAYAAATLVYY